MKNINQKNNKLCLICNNTKSKELRFCRKCSYEQNNYHLMNLDVNVKDYPNLFEYKNKK